MELDKTEQARADFEEVIRREPGSEFSEAARRYIELISGG